MNKCGNCHWLVTERGKPYFCALRDLYTFRDVQDEACSEYAEKNEVEKMTNKLKPCPFCGGEAYILKLQDKEVYFGCCTNCYAESGKGLTIERAIELWNRRADNEPHKWQDKQE